MTIEHFRYPTRAEIDALIEAARRERAEAVARMFRGAVRGLAAFVARGTPADRRARACKRTLPSNTILAKEHPMAESFWKTAAASLPPHVQERYASLFEAAEEYEPVIDFIVTARGRAYRALAQGFRSLADTLRNAARALDAAAWRLTLTR
jgi:hypothetical protein